MRTAMSERDNLYYTAQEAHKLVKAAASSSFDSAPSAPMTVNSEFDPRFREDFRRRWLMAIGDQIINKQNDKAVEMARCMDNVLDVFQSYLQDHGFYSMESFRSAGTSIVDQNRTYNDLPMAPKPTKKKQPSNELPGEGYTLEVVRGDDPRLRKDNDAEQSVNSTVVTKARTLHDMQSTFDNDLGLLSQALSKLTSDASGHSSIGLANHDSLLENTIFLCGSDYDLSVVENLSVVKYPDSRPTQIHNDVQTFGIFKNISLLIIHPNEKWAREGSVLSVMHELEGLCKAVHERCPNCHVVLIGLAEKENDNFIRRFNAALEQISEGLRHFASFANLSDYLFDSAHSSTGQLSDAVFAEFIRKIIRQF